MRQFTIVTRSLLIALVSTVLLQMLVQFLADYLHVSPGIVVAGLLVLAVIPFFICLALIVFFWISSLGSGDYDLAISRAGRISKIQWLRPVYLLVHGNALMYSGRLGEAEEIIQAAIASNSKLGQSARGKVASTLAACYGRILLWSGKPKASEVENEKSVELYCDNFEGQLGLAEAYLCQGDRANDSLPHIEKAILLQRNTIPGFNHYHWIRTYGAHAWALAQLGRFDEAEASLRLAAKKGKEKYVPELALLHLRASIVYGLQGKTDRSLAELQKASELDPNGFVGRRAKEAMAKQRNHQFDYGI